jgi:hypothetical protein
LKSGTSVESTSHTFELIISLVGEGMLMGFERNPLACLILNFVNGVLVSDVISETVVIIFSELSKVLGLS